MNEFAEAVAVLKQVLEEGKHLDESFTGNTSPLARQICYGVIRDFYRLDAIVESLLDKSLPDKHLDLYLLLLAGVYSAKNLNRPAHASVNAAVNATKPIGKPWAKGLTNGVLRNYLRNETELTEKAANSSIEAQYNHPDWLIKMIQEAWPGRDDIFEANNTQAPMTLRVNHGKNSREDYMARLAESDMPSRIGNISDVAIILEQAVPVAALPGFTEGYASVQDEAPQLAATLMRLEPGLNVLDACAAPGGKTCHLLEIESGIELTAIDRDKKRIHRIDENLARLGLKANVVCEDFEDFKPDTLFDRILLDVPCSATGIIRRHPDIKLLRDKSDVAKLSSIQRVLLNKAFDLLKTGGELLYSTCSILPEENYDIVSAFLADHPDAETITLDGQINMTDAMIVTQAGLQLLPTRAEHDGFYYAGIRKVAT
jgi:16S rRNA (cytosine967-C5)-methyltransferase